MTSDIAATDPGPVASARPTADLPLSWCPARTGAGLFGLVVAALGIVLSLGLLVLVASGTVVGLSLVVLAVGATGGVGGSVLLAYWCLRYWSLTYQLDRNGLIVQWPGGTIVLPMGQIESVEPAPRLGRKISRRRLAWPGYHLGRVRADMGAEFTICSAVIFGRHLLVHAGGRAYAIAPADPAAFLAALATWRELGPAEEIRVPPPRPRPAWRALWADRMSRDLIVIALLLSLALLIFLLGKFPTMPSRLPMHWNAAGEVDWIVETRDIFYLPIIGLVIQVVNVTAASWVVRRELMAARLLSGASLFGQLVLWVAVLGIIG